jgi:hypothetical protein
MPVKSEEIVMVNSNKFKGFYIQTKYEIKDILNELLQNGIGHKFCYANNSQTDIIADFSTPLAVICDENKISIKEEVSENDINEAFNEVNQDPCFKEIVCYINTKYGQDTAKIVYGITDYIY